MLHQVGALRGLRVDLGVLMTLRARLLLVYLMVVLLGAATILAAILESEHARRIYGALQPWNDMALAAQKLQAALSTQAAISASTGPATTALAATPDEQHEFLAIIVSQYTKLAEAEEYRNVDQVREALNTLNLRAQSWQALTRQQQADRLDDLRQVLQRYASLVETVLGQLREQKNLQQTRERILLAIGVGLTVVYIVVIGSVLRRWLLRPMEQLGRQVAALARDQPPPEPLLESPREMANLARALDQARRSLGSLRQQLLEAERLTTIGQVAAQLAHNLRNPLASIRAAAQLTARHTPPDSEVRQRLAEIIASVDRMNRWIAGLMEIAKKQPTPVHPGDVLPTLQQVADALRTDLAAKDLRLTLEMPTDGLACVHDPATLEHALVALVVNAIEASPLGATIRLRAERLPDAPAVTQGPHSDPQTVGRCRISVIDQGAGLPPGDPEQVFEYAYSTKQQGMGLGLALAREALRRQGGAAHAMNNPDRGATVYVELSLGPTGY